MEIGNQLLRAPHGSWELRTHIGSVRCTPHDSIQEYRKHVSPYSSHDVLSLGGTLARRASFVTRAPSVAFWGVHSGGALSAVQLFGPVAILETHTLRY